MKNKDGDHYSRGSGPSLPWKTKMAAISHVVQALYFPEQHRWRPLVTWLRPVRVDDFWEKRALKNCSRTPILKFPFEMFRFNLAQGLRKFWMLPYEKWANKLFCFGMSSLIFKNLKMKRNSYPTKQNIRIRNPAFFVYDIFFDSRLFRCLNRAWRSHSRQSRVSW